jgi:hypothetical protein
MNTYFYSLDMLLFDAHHDLFWRATEAYTVQRAAYYNERGHALAALRQQIATEENQ